MEIFLYFDHLNLLWIFIQAETCQQMNAFNSKHISIKPLQGH